MINASAMGLVVEYGGELFYEGIVTVYQPFHVIGKPVIGYHRGDCGKQPHCGGYQGSAMPGATMDMDACCTFPSARKLFMMPQTVPNSPT